MVDSIFNVQVGATFNMKQWQDSFNKGMDSVKKFPALELPGQIGDISLENAEARNFMQNIKAKASSIENLTAEQKSFTDKLGNTVNLITKMGVVYKDTTGEMLKNTQLLNLEQQQILKASGFKISNIKSAEAPIGKQARAVNAEYQKRLDIFSKMGKKADDWGTRAKNMGEKDKQAIEGSVVKLKEKIALYEKMVSEGNVQGLDKLEKQIYSENKALDENISLSKRAAGAVRGWGDSITNAIKQTISYTLSLGVLRQAQKLLNDITQYTIALNTEMVKIQVLQAEGARTPEEIRNLAGSFNQLAKELGNTTIEIAEGSVEWLNL